MKRLKNQRLLHRSISFLIILLFLGLSCDAQNGKIASLASIYAKYRADHSVKNINEFFSNFPSSFAKFQLLYGYDDAKGASPYYAFAEEHITLFYKASLYVEKRIFAEKLFEISRNGKWEADAVNYFQNGLRDFFFKETKTITALLIKKNEKEINGFWCFYADGVHFNEPLYKKTVTSLKSYPILLAYYEKAVKQIKENNSH